MEGGVGCCFGFVSGVVAGGGRNGADSARCGMHRFRGGSPLRMIPRRSVRMYSPLEILEGGGGQRSWFPDGLILPDLYEGKYDVAELMGEDEGMYSWNKESIEELRESLWAESLAACEYAVKGEEEAMVEDVLSAVEFVYGREETAKFEKSSADVEIDIVFDPETGELTIEVMRNDKGVDQREIRTDDGDDVDDISLYADTCRDELYEVDLVLELVLEEEKEAEQAHVLAAEIGFLSHGDDREPSLENFHCIGVDLDLRNELWEADRCHKELTILLDQVEDRFMTLTETIIEYRKFVRNNPEAETSLLYYKELERQRSDAWNQRLKIGEALEDVEEGIQRLRSKQLQAIR